MAVYGVQDPAALAEATQRISRRLGPQRTSAALEAIGRHDWHGACEQMLDYYDRCYDHELERHGAEKQDQLLGSVDLGESSASEAAELLLRSGRVQRRAGGPQGGAA